MKQVPWSSWEIWEELQLNRSAEVGKGSVDRADGAGVLEEGPEQETYEEHMARRQAGESG